VASFLGDNPDLRYYLGPGVDWETLARLAELDFESGDGFASAAEAKVFYGEILQSVGEFVANHVAPYAATIDREGVVLRDGEVEFPPRLAGIFERIGELGLHGLNLPRELGGMNAPFLLYFVTGELFARGDVSVMAHHGFHGGTAMAMLVFSLLEGTTELDARGRIRKTRWQDEIREIVAGRAWGSMDITEPDAGSDMAALRTVGEQDAQGNWFVSGQKIFVTSGHGKYHFVIARTERSAEPDDPKSGLDGLSLFLVAAYRDEPSGRRTRLVSIDRVEEKLGHHGSATVALTFDRAPAELVGKRGEGFRYMLEFMNHARLSVGFESIGLCEAALRMARSYAGERRSMGKPIERHEMIADYLAEMETDLLGLRALAMSAAFHDEIAQKKGLVERLRANGGAAELAAEARRHAAIARRATPLLKYLAAEKAVEMARRCLQIHGGNGYMREFGAEKLLRDALVFPIYEGTSQIQALMATKDTLKGIIAAPGKFLKRSAHARWRALSAADPLERRLARVEQLSYAAQQHIVTRSMAAKVRTARGKGGSAFARELFTKWDPKRDFSFALLHAERLTRLLCDHAILEALFEQARRHSERRPILERYLDRAEPRARFLHDDITSTGRTVLADLHVAHEKEGIEPCTAFRNSGRHSDA
jgi:alkylation response protein AidB-like acyl-CoA dehydrogenase